MRKDDEKLLEEIATLYYEKKYTQREIAQQLGLTIVKVHRLLEKALKKGIVEIRVKKKGDKFTDLENEIATLYKLRGVRIVESNVPFSMMAGECAEKVESILKQQNISGKVIGIGWGRTIYNVLNSNYEWKIKFPSSVVVPLIGGVGTSEAPFQVNDLARKLAQIGECEYFPLNVPFLFEEEKRKNEMMKERDIRKVLSLWERLDIAIVGIGHVFNNSPLLKLSYFTKEDIIEIEGKGAVGDLCARFFQRNGMGCDLNVNKRLVSIELERYYHIPCVIAVACGIYKALPVEAAIKGGYIDYLVTDEEVGEYLLKLANKKLLVKTH